MAHAKEKCNKRSLTDESLLHLATQGPGYKIEKATLKIKTKKMKTRRRKHKVHQQTNRDVQGWQDYPSQRSDLGPIG